jgi:hypothetical protein
MPKSKITTEQLIAWIQKNAEFFHTPEGRPFAKFNRSGNPAVYYLDSLEFRQWLESVYYGQTKDAIPLSVIESVVRTLSAFARHEGIQRQVHLRTAYQNGKYCIDLCDEKWRVVEVDENGWRIAHPSVVMFTRTTSMLALPEPKNGGKFRSILKVINIPEDDWILVLAWIIESLRPNTEYVGLSLFGEKGSAKSSTLQALAELVDPRGASRRTKPKHLEDIFVSAHNGRLISYENLSELSADMQDAFCTALTHGEFVTRKFHSNGDEFRIQLQNPVILNGIKNVVTRTDLLDRFICLQLPLIDSSTRLASSDVAKQFAEMKPFVFGAILKWFSAALKMLPIVTAEKPDLPRKADFALLGEALARSLKKPKGEFFRLFDAAQNENTKHSVTSSPLGTAIVSFIAKYPAGIKGTFDEVLTALRAHMAANADGGKTTGWPETGKAFGNELRRLMPAMAQIGVVIEIGPRTGRGSVCSIRRTVTRAAA